MQIQDMYVILNFLVAAVKKEKETSEINFSNTFNLTNIFRILSLQHVIHLKVEIF